MIIELKIITSRKFSWPKCIFLKQSVMLSQSQAQFDTSQPFQFSWKTWYLTSKRFLVAKSAKFQSRIIDPNQQRDSSKKCASFSQPEFSLEMVGSSKVGNWRIVLKSLSLILSQVGPHGVLFLSWLTWCIAEWSDEIGLLLALRKGISYHVISFPCRWVRLVDGHVLVVTCSTSAIDYWQYEHSCIAIAVFWHVLWSWKDLSRLIRVLSVLRKHLLWSMSWSFAWHNRSLSLTS